MALNSQHDTEKETQYESVAAEVTAEDAESNLETNISKVPLVAGGKLDVDRQMS